MEEEEEEEELFPSARRRALCCSSGTALAWQGLPRSQCWEGGEAGGFCSGTQEKQDWCRRSRSETKAGCHGEGLVTEIFWAAA